MRHRLLTSLLSAAAVAVALSGCGGAQQARPADTAAPVPVDLPTPDGPHAVGYVAWPDAGTGVTVRYPAEADSGLPGPPYFSDRVAAALDVDPQHVALVRTSAREGAAPAGSGPRHVVVLMPGFGAPVELSTGLAEHLASHGYVVVSVPTDVAVEAAADEGPDDDTREAREQGLEQVLAALLDPGRAQALVAAAGPIDPARVAVGGHSYAGSIAFNAALVDDRITAVFDLDGSLLESARETPVTVPALMLTTELGVAKDTGTRDVIDRTGTAVTVGMVDAGHYDVTDAPLLLPAIPRARELELGGIGPEATRVTDVVVKRFLDSALGDEPRTPAPADLLDGLTGVTEDPW